MQQSNAVWTSGLASANGRSNEPSRGSAGLRVASPGSRSDEVDPAARGIPAGIAHHGAFTHCCQCGILVWHPRNALGAWCEQCETALRHEGIFWQAVRMACAGCGCALPDSRPRYCISCSECHAPPNACSRCHFITRSLYYLEVPRDAWVCGICALQHLRHELSRAPRSGLSEEGVAAAQNLRCRADEATLALVENIFGEGRLLIDWLKDRPDIQ